ncbi:hypothetical protein [Nocardioides sp. GY 10127]|uniref:hypothetical protein n=1 Tax=Nocardioides sp. GY 10127 TaxID=2569762 RepID=UPI0010A7F513|nr:hypothetical protein [Nocardioides sp. GY 10127]TIC78811.1 hypothetical protein E8D37_19130 [Nocardioides sp. GY 10127]
MSSTKNRRMRASTWGLLLLWGIRTPETRTLLRHRPAATIRPDEVLVPVVRLPHMQDTPKPGTQR